MNARARHGNQRYGGRLGSCVVNIPLLLLFAIVLVISATRVGAADSSIPLGARPDRVLISPEDELYISNESTDSLTVIDVSSWNSIHRIIGKGGPWDISVGKRPGPMAISKDGTRLFVGARGGFEFRDGASHAIEGSVSVIDTSSKKLVATIPVGGEIIDLAVTPDGKKLYLAMGGPPAEVGLKKILLTDGHPVSWVSQVRCPQAVVFTPDGQRAYVNYQCAPRPGSPGHDPIMVYDAQTDSPVPLAIIYGWADGTLIANVGGPLAISPDGRQVWAAANDACSRRDAYDPNGDPRGGCPSLNPNERNIPYAARGLLNVISTDTNRLIERISVLGYDERDRTSVLGAYSPTFSPDGRHAAVITGNGIRYYTSGNPSSAGNRDLQRTYPTSTRASGVAFTQNGYRAYAALPDENRLAEIDIVVPTATPVAIVIAIALAAIVAVALAWVLVAAFRQRVLRLLRARWRFVAGSADEIFDVGESQHGARVTPRYPSPIIEEIVLKLPINGPAPAELVQLADHLQGRTASIVVDRSLFGIAWQPLFGSDWAKGNRSCVAGQAVRSDGFKFKQNAKRARLVFAALAYAGRGPDRLHGVDLEVRAAVRVFRRWGASLYGDNGAVLSAKVGDLANALRSADVVHVAAHGSPTGIFLADGKFAASDVPRNHELRARLVILSACETLFSGKEDSIVWWLVSNRCSVIATQRPVDDQACRWFFAALYADLLPGPKVTGRQLSAAIRVASEDVLRQIDRLTDHNGQKRILETLSSFVLYGDPTMHLELTFSGDPNV